MDLFSVPAMNNAYNICHNVQVGDQSTRSFHDQNISGFLVLERIQISKSSEEGTEEEERQKMIEIVHYICTKYKIYSLNK